MNKNDIWSIQNEAKILDRFLVAAVVSGYWPGIGHGADDAGVGGFGREYVVAAPDAVAAKHRGLHRARLPVGALL